LGNGTTTASNSPVQVTGITTASAVAVGRHHSCALLQDQSIKCWGRDNFGQLGDDAAVTATATTPVAVSGISTAIGIDTKVDHTCALLGDKTVKCWGNNSGGQLGDNSTTNRMTPVAVGSLSTVANIAVGEMHSCAILANGEGRCWGQNTYGQLGNNSTTSSNTPVTVSNLSGATAIDLGNNHGCAIVTNNQLNCWGRNDFGQAGGGGQVPAAVSFNTSDTSVSQISLGGDFTCAVVTGTLFCFGNNTRGQIVNLETYTYTTPVAMLGAGTVSQIATGQYSTMVTAPNGVSRTWGTNFAGHMGIGDTNVGAASSATTGEGLYSGISAVTVGSSGSGQGHTCILQSGQVKCWGYGGLYQLGQGSTSNSETPLTVSLSSVQRISAGYGNTCATTSGNSYCWGWQGNYNFGVGGTDTKTGVTYAPYARYYNNYHGGVYDYGNITPYTSLVTGQYMGCGILTQSGSGSSASNTLRCWGYPDGTVLGRTSSTYNYDYIEYSGYWGYWYFASYATISSGVAEIALGSNHGCARLSNGTVQCWGYSDYGENGTASATSSATQVISSGATSIASGPEHTCAVVSGAVYCWGRNNVGQLGTGDTVNRNSPSLVAQIASGAVQVSAGAEHTCARLSSGIVKCWGRNQYGQVGSGSAASVSTPTTVPGLDTVSLLSNGYNADHTCAVHHSNWLSCWGDGTSGQTKSIIPLTSVPKNATTVMTAY
jgi:alpha-tubulin suppressor-like RCC1 family protein